MCKRIVAIVLPAVLTLLAACSGKHDGSAPVLTEAPRNPGGSGSAEVTYRPEVRVVEQREGYDALISVSTDGSILVFDRRRGHIPVMKDGEILLIKGLLARRVVTSISKGDEYAVLTAPAALLDVVSDAKIRVQAPIRFGRSQPLAQRVPTGWPKLADALVSPAYAENDSAPTDGKRDDYGNLARKPFEATLSGWETKFFAEPAPGRLNLTLQLKRSLANVTAVIDGSGYLADFDFSSDIDVVHGTLERMQTTYRKLNGNMNFRWAVQTTDKGKLLGNARMKLPAAIEIPLYQYLGGLPLYLEISSAVIIKPALGAEYEFAHGALRVTFNGQQSFGIKAGNVDADGQLTGDTELLESDAGSGAPIGIVVAFAAPRLELSLGVSKILKFDGMKEAAAMADGYIDLLVTKAFGADGLEKFKSSPLSQVTASKIVDAAMGSEAAAYIELLTTAGMSHTGSTVMVPCIRTDVFLSAKVGVSAKAMGQSVGDVDKEIFKKTLTRVRPSENKLCNGI